VIGALLLQVDADEAEDEDSGAEGGAEAEAEAEEGAGASRVPASGGGGRGRPSSGAVQAAAWEALGYGAGPLASTVVVRRRSGFQVAVPADALGPLLEAYSVLRSFSFQVGGGAGCGGALAVGGRRLSGEGGGRWLVRWRWGPGCRSHRQLVPGAGGCTRCSFARGGTAPAAAPPPAPVPVPRPNLPPAAPAPAPSQLKLSPFSLEDLTCALVSGAPSNLLDELHCCLLRALALYETPELRELRRLPLDLLDHASWPEFVWEYLEVAGDKDLLRLRCVCVGRPAAAARPSGSHRAAVVKVCVCVCVCWRTRWASTAACTCPAAAAVKVKVG
jgi:hypothetical protein